MAHGSIWWSECITSDVEGAKAHYGAVCGWTFDGMPMPGGATYWVAKMADKPVAGIMSVGDLMTETPVPPHWMVYIAVSDLDAALKAATGAGGKIVQPAFNVPGVGDIAMVAEPGGAVSGIMQPDDMSG